MSSAQKNTLEYTYFIRAWGGMIRKMVLRLDYDVNNERVTCRWRHRWILQNFYYLRVAILFYLAWKNLHYAGKIAKCKAHLFAPSVKWTVIIYCFSFDEIFLCNIVKFTKFSINWFKLLHIIETWVGLL